MFLTNKHGYKLSYKVTNIGTNTGDRKTIQHVAGYRFAGKT